MVAFALMPFRNGVQPPSLVRREHTVDADEHRRPLFADRVARHLEAFGGLEKFAFGRGVPLHELSEIALRAVEIFIAELPPKQRVALVQRKYLEQGYAEIAAALGTSEEAARRNVHEALRKLRAQFGDRL